MIFRRYKSEIINSNRDDRGFSLVEATIALVILLVGLLGVFSVMVYAVRYNAMNNTRAQALAVLQQEAEEIRRAQFTLMNIDSSLLGGVKATKTIVTNNNNEFQIDVSIDDDPFTPGLQIDSSKPMKEITLRVRAINLSAGAQLNDDPVLVIRRVKSN
ncbi:MAG: prepilin-type N-terminal cleavage/methylation domain-containing protein [Pyrinomonadaceae bacterium]